MDIEHLEALALSEDRAAALEQLIVGTEEHYFHDCLLKQHAGKLHEVDAVLRAWIKRHGRTTQVQEIERRQALLCFEDWPKETAEYVIDQLDLHFDHQRRVEGQRPKHATRLDQALISRDHLLGESLARHPKTLDGFTDAATSWLLDIELDAARRRKLLERVGRPDHPKLLALILEDLADKRSSGFGAHRIHGLLLPEQLQELAERRPKLEREASFVNARLVKLWPNPDVDWEHDLEEKRRYLDRLWDYVSTLAPALNGLRVHVAHHRLDLERRLGNYDRAAFLSYLKLPRNCRYMAPEYLRARDVRDHLVQLGGDYRSATQLPQVADDEPLVRDYLGHFFETDRSYDAYSKYVAGDYLKRWFALTKIARGLGDREQWYSMLDDPAAYQRFRQRVEIDLAVQNETHFRANDAVRIVAEVKNVPTMVVKVFEINARNYFLEHGREVDTSVDLDGLVAREETTHSYDEPPERRVRREFAFSALDGPGTYVVELIGNGKSSRALIKKGGLRLLERLSAAGHELTILDEDNHKLEDASLWFGGREYEPDDEGHITLPYSTHPRRAKILLCHGQTCTLESFDHKAESYRLRAAMFVDREQLKPKETARVLVRVGLELNGVPVDPSLLEEATLVVHSTDRFDVSSSKELSGLSLSADGESECELRVPENLAEIRFELRGHVKQITTGDEVSLSASQSYPLNGIDRTDFTEAFHLSRTRDGVVLYLLGRTGEARAHQAIELQLRHRLFTDDVLLTLQTDERGRVELGELEAITWLQAHSPAGVCGNWTLRGDGGRFSNVVHLLAGQSAAIPYIGPPIHRSWFQRLLRRPLREAVSLLERRGGSFHQDWTSAVTLKDGYLVVTDLPAGDYDLLNKLGHQSLTIRVTDGVQLGSWALSQRRFLETRRRLTLNVTDVQVDGDKLAIRLGGVTPATRVHVFGSRFYPEGSAGEALASVARAGPQLVHPGRGRSHYVSGRDIGDEYRYVLERKLQKKLPGNMLGRPGLLLNPWAVRNTDTGLDEATKGEAYGASPPPLQRAMRAPAPAPGAAPPSLQSSANVDFLVRQGALKVNLRPQEGMVEVPLSELEGATTLAIVVVDHDAVVWREMALPEVDEAHDDLRLRLALDADQHFTERRQKTVLRSGHKLVIEDIATAKVQTFDSIHSVYALMSTLMDDEADGDDKLVELGFVTCWPELTQEDKRDQYSEHACHELNLFLQRKDPSFFAEVIQPYLRSKKDKTFMDHYLLEDDLRRYLEPWRHGQLNVVERILLGQRLDPDATRRHVQDHFDLLERDLERDARLFKTALEGSALDAEDQLGFAEAREDAVLLSLSEVMASEAAPAAMPAGPPPPGAAPQGMGVRRPRAMMKKAAFEAGGMLPMDAPAAVPVAAYEQLAEADADSFGDDLGGIGGRDLEKRDEMRQLFRQADTTEELAENNYYKRPFSEQGPDLVTVNAFWRDFAASDPDELFISENVVEASNNFTEMMLALAVLDLPFKPQEPQVRYAKVHMELEAASPTIVFHKEIKATAPADTRAAILVSQNYFRKDDRYTYDGAEELEKYVTGELLTHVVYVCQVILTNPTSARQKLELLLQIPRGALPVDNGFFTKGRAVELDSYETESIEYAFYFPAVGEASHFPAHISKNEEVVAAAKPTTLPVVERLSELDEASWAYVSQHGDDEVVLAYLRDHNIDRLDLSLIAWRMKERGFFEQTLSLLHGRHVYDDTLWSYAHKHVARDRLREHLEHQESFLRSLGLAFDSALMTVDPVERRWHEHLEYLPLINARAHRLGAKIKILNSAFEQQYRRFLRTTCYRKQRAADDLLTAAYYLFLQDRLEAGIAMLKRVGDTPAALSLQHDYLRAYVAFYEEDLGRARELAERHRAHPVDRWRKLFANVLAHIDEAEKVIGGGEVVDADDRAQRLDELAAAEPSFELEVVDREVRLTYRNLERCSVSYFPMDVELLFSRQPFVEQDSDRFAVITPRRRDPVELPPGGEHRFALPAEFHSANVIVEVVAQGMRKAQASFAHDLSLQIVEQYGQVRVRHRKSQRPLSKAYVKVFARNGGGSVTFYKDGYTDLRGYFDYATLSTDELDQVQRFALLVMTETDGALIREAAPPQR